MQPEIIAFMVFLVLMSVKALQLAVIYDRHNDEE